MSLDADTLSRWVGHRVSDPEGNRIGDLIQVYVVGDQPRWLAIKRGTMTTRIDFAPASMAATTSHGLGLPFGAEILHNAPPVANRHQMTDDEERALNNYYANIAQH